MLNIIVSVGHDTVHVEQLPDEPINTDVLDAIEGVGGTVVARIDGVSHSDRWGYETGLWVAARIPREGDARLRAALCDIAGKYGQEAIAYTSGYVTLLGPDGALD